MKNFIKWLVRGIVIISLITLASILLAFSIVWALEGAHF